MRISIRSAHRLRLTALLVGLTISTLTGCDSHASNARSHLPPSPPLATVHDRDPVAALVRAFAAVESSGRNLAPYLDCPRAHAHSSSRCYAFGLYAFHLPRWLECGGPHSGWGTASTGEQEAVMRTAITRYTRRCPYPIGSTNWAIWCSNYHNLGHGSMRRTPYVTRIIKEFTHGR